MSFEPIVKAAKNHDRASWALADALLHNATSDDRGPAGLDAVVACLAENGLEYSNRYLRLLRQAAGDFPAVRRYDGEHNTPIVVLRSHVAAGNPDTLDVIVKVARKEGHSITLEYIEDVLRQLREEERERREKERRAAQEEADRAAEQERRALERQKHAKDEQEREEAKRARSKAKKQKEDAQARRKAAKGKPKRRDTKPPREDEISPLAARAHFMRNANEAKKLAGRSMKILKPHIPELSQAATAGLTDAALTVANAWRDAATALQRLSGRGKGHLSVVNQ